MNERMNAMTNIDNEYIEQVKKSIITLKTENNIPSDTINFIIDILSKEIPKRIEIKPWSPAICPRCKCYLSEHKGDGYFKHFKHLDRCPNTNCCQAIEWD